MRYTYLMGDDGGVSNCESDFIVPIGTQIRHPEWGLYEVRGYYDDNGHKVQRTLEITQIDCERIKK